jgi:hypothetical protein
VKESGSLQREIVGAALNGIGMALTRMVGELADH